MAQTSLMTLLFGKKRRRRISRKGKSTGKKLKKFKKPKGLTAVIKKQAQKYKVRLTLKSGKYRKLSQIKKDIKKKRRAKMSKRGHLKRTRRRTHRKRRSAFGVGGSYMPISSFMSPYPYSVDSSPPWV